MEKSLKSELKSKSMCVSHIKDIDGLVSVALIKLATKSHFLLANYGNINDCLRRIHDTYQLIYICDLGINETLIKEFARIRKFADLIYIDHHPLDSSLLDSLHNLGVQVIHNQLDCAGVLTYNLFHSDFSHEAGLLACYAAISDRLENGPLAKKLLPHYDRDFVLQETMLLSYAIEKADSNYKKKLVNWLAELEYPHRMPDVMKLACEQIERVAVLRGQLGSRSQRIGDIFYADSGEFSPGTIANLLMDICAANVCVGIDTNKQTEISDLSIRASPKVKINLGKKVSKLAKRFGGIGGGHSKASGARIPASKLVEFLQALDDHTKSHLQ